MPRQNSLIIRRQSENRTKPAILQRVADIPGGVSVDTSNLGGSVLNESTPIGKHTNGLYRVVKTGRLVTKLTASAKTIEVEKGHHFIVGDYVGTDSIAGKQITAVDKSGANKDVLTISAALGALEIGDTIIATKEATTDLAVTPFALVGATYDVESGVDAWTPAEVICTVREEIAEPVTENIKTALKNVVYL